MVRRKRQFSTFSLSFLDIMSCGFGAVALIFLIIKHEADTRVEVDNQAQQAEVNRLQEEIRQGREELVQARNTLSDVDQRLAEAQGLARRINEDIDAVRNRIARLDEDATDQQIESLREKLEEARVERERLEQEAAERGQDVRRFLGEGQRQYLTGLKLGGSRILILVDASASMLDDTLVNIIRKRNMSDAVKRRADKWLHAVNTVQWLTANFPRRANYQLYTFNTQYQSMIEGSEGQWLNIGDRNELEQVMVNLEKVIPSEGTSLENVFAGIGELDPLPDNIFLITDGLPTQGKKPPGDATVSGNQRLKLFRRARDTLPAGIPLNIILLPMEGDWMAAAEYWKLAQATDGAFLTPSEDWP